MVEIENVYLPTIEEIEDAQMSFLDVKIYSREEIENQIVDGNKFENCFIISFCDKLEKPVDFSGILANVIVCKVDDIFYDELADEGYSYDEFFSEAKDIADAIRKAVDKKEKIICQCEHGQSRSAGCAAAILEYYEKSGIKIFSDYKRCPNQVIYNKIYDALIQNM